MVRARKRMETTTFYDEQPFYTTGNSANMNNGSNFLLAPNLNNNNNNNNNNNQIGRVNNNNLKFQLSLDLNNIVPANVNYYQSQQVPVQSSRRLKFVDPAATFLSSPDLSMCKLPSPEMEKLIAQTASQTTPTPTSLIFPRTVTEEQELYARGFVEALNDLHHSNSSSHNSPTNSTTATYTNLDQSIPRPQSLSIPPVTVAVAIAESAQNFPALNSISNHVIKEEPQTVPSLGNSPPVSPIDMESQERIKLERKRLRNRLAASKCRKRKLERISRLEERVKTLKNENADLSITINRLRENVCHLKEQVMDHMNAGCQIIPSSFL